MIMSWHLQPLACIQSPVEDQAISTRGSLEWSMLGIIVHGRPGKMPRC